MGLDTYVVNIPALFRPGVAGHKCSSYHPQRASSTETQMFTAEDNNESATQQHEYTQRNHEWLQRNSTGHSERTLVTQGEYKWTSALYIELDLSMREMETQIQVRIKLT